MIRKAQENVRVGFMKNRSIGGYKVWWIKRQHTYEYQFWETLSGKGLDLYTFLVGPPAGLAGCCVIQTTGLNGLLVLSIRTFLMIQVGIQAPKYETNTWCFIMKAWEINGWPFFLQNTKFKCTRFFGWRRKTYGMYNLAPEMFYWHMDLGVIYTEAIL